MTWGTRRASRPAAPLGIIYVAIRAQFVREAALSAQSVRRFMPNVPIVLFTDHILETNDAFDEIIHLSPPHPKYHINKLVAMAQSPFEKTLLLDTDTYVCAEVSDLFAILERFDIAMAHDRAFIDDFPKDSGVPDAFVEFNQGVVAFRRSVVVQEALKEALRLTERHYKSSGTYPYDQPPLRIGLFHSKVRIATLPREYNCRFASYEYLNGVVRILHGRLPNRIMRPEDFERVAGILNRVTVPRVLILGALFAMSTKSLLGHSYWTPTLVGHLWRPHLTLFEQMLASFRNSLRNFK
jgi:hypothetical protein